MVIDVNRLLVLLLVYWVGDVVDTPAAASSLDELRLFMAPNEREIKNIQDVNRQHPSIVQSEPSHREEVRQGHAVVRGSKGEQRIVRGIPDKLIR